MGPRSTILLVDDREANLLALSAVLEPLGHRLVRATSGRDALKFLLADECALILLDVQMPLLDGFETAALIRKRERSRYTPIIFVTAVHREEAHIVKGYAHGAVDYILKPFEPSTLVAKVRFFMQQHERHEELKREAADRTRERDELLVKADEARLAAEGQRAYLHDLLMQAPAAIAILRGRDHVFELANPLYEQLFGRRDLAGRAGPVALPELVAQGTWKIFDRVYETGEPFVGKEYSALVDRQGNGTLEQCFFNFVAQPTRDARGQVDGILLHAVEITESVQARREVEGLAEKLKKADNSKDEFLAMLAHELRNPLAPIVTALQLMNVRQNAQGAVRERNIIERQVHHLARIVDDLLDVSRITRGVIDLRRESVELSTVVERAVEVAQPLVDARQHQLRVSVPATGLLLDADPVRLAQVIANLLNNAAKYTNSGGRLEIEGGREGAEVVVRVRDNGQGIAPERIGSMFELFVQGDRSLDRAQGGLGIGLTLARRLVELHGGTLEAKSAGPFLGSEFTVRLRESQGTAGDGTFANEGAPKAARRRRVLVVDDNVDAAELLGEALSQAGHEVKREHDGESAVGAAAKFRPDVVLLDLGLPGMDGYEVARRLRTHPGLERVRIIAITGYGQEADRSRTAEAGIDEHLVKPVDLDLVIAAVARG
jgi:DNA-binding response OmpR family regulator/nitrogen-specific signal transduction histidine kinase